MRITFIRHAQSMGNLNGDYSTDSHDELSPNGLVQTETLGGHLEHKSFTSIYCSPSRRAVQTILPYVNNFGHKIELWAELDEACWQEERTQEDVKDSRYMEGHRLDGLELKNVSFINDIPLIVVEGETYAEGIARLSIAKQRLIDLHSACDDDILVVSHAFSISRLIEMFLDIEPVGRIDHENTGITMLEYENGNSMVKYVNRVF